MRGEKVVIKFKFQKSHSGYSLGYRLEKDESAFEQVS